MSMHYIYFCGEIKIIFLIPPLILSYAMQRLVLRFLRPSQPNGVMSSVVSLPYQTFTGQAWSSKRLTSTEHILSPETDNCPS